MQYIIIFSLIIFLILGILKNKKNVVENYPWHYRPIHNMEKVLINNKYIVDIAPSIVLPPTDFILSKKNKLDNLNTSQYCDINPLCYPCKNWKYLGYPNCI